VTAAFDAGNTRPGQRESSVELEDGMRTATCRMVLTLVGSLCVAVVAAQDPTLEDLRKLEGGWIVVAAEQRGKPLNTIKGGGLLIDGHTFLLRTAASSEFKGEIRIEASKSPKQLDFIHAGTGVVWQAIYTVDEETFRLNYVEAGGRDRRPTLFATSSDSAGTVIVMNRLAKSAEAR
jgi:uncharacterized protein (TIGR03067 family)